MRQIYREAQYVELNKSYRSTYEIIKFARGIQNVTALEPMARHGEEPAVLKCTNSAAKELWNGLQDIREINLLFLESSDFINGVSITSIQMSKGLEFDEVVIVDVDRTHYVTEYDRSLLYIACTRAMHKLTLLYTGALTDLIDSI